MSCDCTCRSPSSCLLVCSLILSSYQPSPLLRREEDTPDVSVLQSRGAWMMPISNRRAPPPFMSRTAATAPSTVRLTGPSPLVPILVAQPHSLWSIRYHYPPSIFIAHLRDASPLFLSPCLSDTSPRPPSSLRTPCCCIFVSPLHSLHTAARAESRAVHLQIELTRCLRMHCRGTGETPSHR
jgi:hypothetical protein